ATTDIANAFFSIPLVAECRPPFAFTWRGVQYTWNRLPQGWKHSPTICHGLIQTALEQGGAPEHLQYIDDSIVWGNTAGEVFEKGKEIVQILLKAEVEVPPEKCQGPSREVKFLGTWWIAGSAAIPPDTLSKIEQLQMPQFRKELQQLMSTLVYWRKHIPGFSIIAHPLYSVLQKGKPWKRNPELEEAVKTLIQELKTYQSLEPVHAPQP
ncbi:Retrovirus-related Pol polyprotein from transposon 17.6, partial [Spheniscus demersus]